MEMMKKSGEANKLIYSINCCESFAAVAKEFSMDPGSAQKCGDLCYFEKERRINNLKMQFLNEKLVKFRNQ